MSDSNAREILAGENLAAGLTGRTREQWLGRSVLVLLIVMLPLALAVGGLAAWQSWDNYRASFEQRLHETARSSALAIEARLSSYHAAAPVLALSPQLQPDGNPEIIEGQARAAADEIGGWIGITSADTPPRLLLNTRLPPGPVPAPSPSPADATLSAMHDRLIATATPQISNLFTSPIFGEPMVLVAVPVIDRSPGVSGTHVLGSVDVGVSAAGLGSLLARQALGNGAYAAVIDASGHIVARSRDQAAFVGRAVPSWSATAFDNNVRLSEGVVLDGRRSLIAYQPLAVAPGWRVVVVEPLAGFASIVTRPLLRLMAAIAMIPLVLLAALGLVWWRHRDEQAAYGELDRVLADVPALVFVDLVRPDGRRERQFLSRSVGQLTGWSWEEMRQSPNLLIDSIQPDEQANFNEFRCNVLESGRASLEFRARHRDGHIQTWRSTEAVIERHPDGSRLVVGCVTDISDESAVKDRLRQVEKLAVLGEVATGIAHEINQPLTVIAMAAENGTRSLERDPPGVARAVEKFDMIKTQAHRMGAVIDHIRVFGRVDASTIAPFSVAPVVQDALTLIEARLLREGIEVTTAIAPDLPAVRGISVMLEQVLLNLLVNAADAYRDAPPRNARPLLISAEAQDGRVLISIADQAGGIADDALGRIFDPFFTTKPPGKGTGLGLSISLATVAEMGGQITAHNDGGGAVFRILLPIAEPADAPRGARVTG